MKRVCAVVFLMGLAATLLPAQSTDAPEPFTASELDRFIRDWDDVEMWMENHGEALADVEDPTRLAQYMAGADLNRYLESKGWESGRFFEVAATVASALYAIEFEEQMPEMASQFEQQKKAIRDNPGLTPAQKQEMIAQMDQVMQQMSGFAATLPVTDGEKQLVRGRKPELMEIFE